MIPVPAPPSRTAQNANATCPSSRFRSLLSGLLLAVAAWVLYLPSVRYGFVYYDDVRILRDHPELYGQPRLSADLRAIFVTCFPREEPLLARDVTWALDSRLFGFGNPLGYHLGNVLLHGVVVALLFAFLLGTTRRYGFALATALAWLFLAVHTEPVAWIMGRKDILSALFMLLALGAQTRRLTSKSPAGHCGWYVLTTVFFLAGLLSKISVLTFPLVLFLHAILFPYLRGEQPPEAPLQSGRALAREALLMTPNLAISGLIYVWYQRTLAQIGMFDRGYAARGLAHVWNLFMIDPLTLWLYLKQVFLPWGLSVFYTWPSLRPGYPPSQIAVALATVGIACGAGVWLFRRHKDLFFYYGAFFVLMVPYLNLLYIGIWMAERYLYFPAFCIVALACSLASAALRRPHNVMRLGVLTTGALFVAINAFQSLSYQREWRNAETLWQYHITLPRPSPTAYENLAAYYYAVAAEHPEASRMALPVKKMSIVVEAGLAEFWPDRGQPPPPATAYLFFLKSIVEELTGEPEAALASLLTSDRLRPGADATNLNLARLYRNLARAAADPRQRRSYACAARDRFLQYLKLAFRGRLAPTEVRQELAAIEAECSALDQLPGSGQTGPAAEKSHPDR